MLPDEVSRALARMEHDDPQGVRYVRAHLLARETEVERLRDDLEREQGVRDDAQRQHKRAEALLRECMPRLGPEYTRDGLPINPDAQLHARITAHLSENSRG